jgi:hypothetical protein
VGEAMVLGDKVFFKNGIQKPVKCWQMCIEVGGDYVEK